MAPAPILFHQLAIHHGDRYHHYNFEQDLGIPGFRKNKRSCGPVWLLRKYRVSLQALPEADARSVEA